MSVPVGQVLRRFGHPQRPRRRIERSLLLPALAFALVVVAASCRAPAVDREPGAGLAAPIPDSTFGRLVAELSEAGAYFDTDNLISNESSYLHVVGALRRLDVSGGAYIGVGPGQNFSYVAAIRPKIAFILDIRRDNLLQQLMFKALFESASDRIRYLCLLTGRPLPDELDGWESAPIEELLEHVDRTAPTPASVRAAVDSVESRLGRFWIELDEQDLTTIRRFHGAFIRSGLDLQFQTHGRAPLWYYPTLRQLLLETDLEGERVNYLATEADYRYLRELSERNLIIPVVGDFAGGHALPAIGRYIEAQGEEVSAFYTSNVEFYLMENGVFDRFAASVAELPRAYNAVIIRSVFRGPFGNRHPQRQPGYYSTQTLQPISEFVAVLDEGGFRSYSELVTRGSLDLRALRATP